MYDSHTSDDAPFFRTAIGDNVHSLGLASPSEVPLVENIQDFIILFTNSSELAHHYYSW